MTAVGGIQVRSLSLLPFRCHQAQGESPANHSRLTRSTGFGDGSCDTPRGSGQGPGSGASLAVHRRGAAGPGLGVAVGRSSGRSLVQTRGGAF